ncbi:MAG: virulence factor SrfB [Candidatus Rifleibacteriota bacterium]
MEKLEFLVSTGISFYAPDFEYRLSDLLLQKMWHFRVLQSPNGPISLQLGTEPITNAIAGAAGELVDIGGLSIRFQDAIETCMGKWIPLPYSKKNAAENSSRSVDWARAFLYRSPLQIDENVFRMVLAVDTTMNPASSNGETGENRGLFPEDIGIPLEVNPGSITFWQTPAMITWIKSVFKGVPAEGSEKVPPYAASLAAFIALADGLKQAEVMPEITILHPEGEEIGVSLILDLGNSRACGILVEQTPGQPVSLDECCKLEIRDLQEPGEVYTEPFDTSFKFQPPLFYDAENAIPQSTCNFRWPSIVRLGHEAAKLEPSDVGDTGMSSPKRYLWDETPRHFPWYFNLNDEGPGKKISADFLKYFDENGFFKGENAHPPFEPCYPPSSMMSFLMLEILGHAYAQINSYSYRKSRGHRLAARTLKNIVITTPCGMSLPERELYISRVQSAIDTFFHVNTMPAGKKPALHLEFDEATAVQLTYLFGEVKHRFLGDAKEAIATLGRERTSKNGIRESVFRLASIDIGGGTSDLMIAEYVAVPSEQTGVQQRMLFSEGFSVAGDEIAKRIIEKLILRRIFNWAAQKNPNIAWEDFQIFFGPGRGGRDKNFNDMKAELCRQIWIPMAHRHLEFAELDSDDPDIELSFDRFFPYRLPSANVLDFFADQMRKEFNCDITLPEIPWEISRSKVNAVISNVIENILRLFSEVISQFDCDALILGGKPSSLPIIREILVKLMPVPSSRIIGLKGYSVGNWYPFSQKGGGISDPKTTCVMGAVVWLFAEKLNNLDGLSLTTDNSMIRRRECFIGTFSPEVMTLTQSLFPTPGDEPATLETNRSVLLGIRRIDSEVCMVNPIWEVVLNKERLKANGPFKIKLSQDQNNRECLSVIEVLDENGKKCNVDSVRLRLRTMLADQYWLDTGCFDL